MKAYDYILAKQTQWALNQGFPPSPLVGSKGKRGRPAYTQELEQNLFDPLSPSVRDCFENGDGDEISGNADNPAKMQAVHSSSALSVNVFQYWQNNNQLSAIASACGFCGKENNSIKLMKFEDKYPISARFRISPNIDVVFHNEESSRIRRYAVECKFSEAYSTHRHAGLKPKYIGLEEVWTDIPKLLGFANSICPDDDKYQYLHPAQLIKHILGLKVKCGKYGFKLLYLWYDVLGEEGATHRDEIKVFSEIALSDGILFHAMSYQELIIGLAAEYRERHNSYIRYLTERYL